jgi:ornithine carbamoyltransferase
VLGQRESVRDVARNLDRFVDGIVVRTGPHEVAVELASQAEIPVINGLTLREHPCQALADVFTMRERFGRLEGLVVAFVGDGNNVYHSLALLGAALGMEVRLAHPAGYAPNEPIVARARALAKASGGRLTFGHDPFEAVRGAAIVYTDAWTSMGQEAETEERRDAFAGFRVDDALLDAAGPDVLAMHCLPAHRGEEITSAVMDGPRSLIWEESENRLHVQKALLVEILGEAVSA